MPAPIGSNPSNIIKGVPFGTPRGGGRNTPTTGVGPQGPGRGGQLREPGPFSYDNPPPAWWQPTIEQTGLPPLVFGEYQPPPDFSINRSARGKPVPICYGRCMMPLYYLFGPRTYGNIMVSTWMGPVGEIEGFESIFIDGREGSVWNNGTHGSSININAASGTLWLQLTQWHGLTSQPVDPSVTVWEPTYADTNVYNARGINIGISYLTMVQHALGSDGPALPRAIVKGIKCFDPRLSGGAGGYAYTENPALFLADFLANDYGAKQAIDWDSVSVAADYCDFNIGGQPRFWGGAVLDQDLGIEQHITRLRAIASCMVRVQGNTFYLVPNGPSASVFTFTSNNVVQNTMRPSYRDIQDQPTRVEVEFTATTDGTTELETWTTRKAIYDDGTQPGQSTLVSLLDARSHEVAYRYALRQYRQQRFAPWQATWQTMDAAAPLYHGERVTVDHPEFGPTPVEMRITRIQTTRSGLATIWTVTAQEYDEALFADDDVPDTPFIADTTFDPLNPPQLTGAITAEEMIGPDITGVLLSRVRITFLVENWPYTDGYAVTIDGLGQTIEFFVPQGPENSVIDTYSPDLSRIPIQRGGAAVTIGVRVRSTIPNAQGPVKSQSLRIYGKWAPPPDTTFIRVIMDDQLGELEVSWNPVRDLGGPVTYSLRFSFDETATFDTAQKAHRGRLTDTTYRIGDWGDTQSGTVYLFIKAIDANNIPSRNAGRTLAYIDSTTNRLQSFDLWPEDMLLTGFEQYTQFGRGLYVMASEPGHRPLDRFGAMAGAWNNIGEPLYHDMPWTTNYIGSLILPLGYTMFPDYKMRACSWQGDIVQNQSGLTNPGSIFRRENLSTQTVAVNSAHATLNWFSPDIEYREADFLSNTIGVFTRFPITIDGRVAPLSQTGLVSTNVNQSPHQINFPEPYSETPVARAPITTISGAGRSITMSIAYIDKEVVQYISDASSGGNNQTFNFTWEVIGN